MKPIEEQTLLITGATDGLGKMVSGHFARRLPTLLLHGRNPKKGQRLISEMKRSTGNDKIFYFNADLSSLEEVRSLAEQIKKEYGEINMLINNAGIGGNKSNERELSEDGYELRFAVNYLAPFLLTHLLLPLITLAAPSKIINVGSGAQVPLDFDNIMLEKGYTGLRAYSQSKLALLMFSLSLAEKLKSSTVTVNCVHPASLMNTKMVINYFGYSKSTIEEGAESVEFVASSPQLDHVTGMFFDGKEPGKGHPQVYDPVARKKLYDLSLKLTGLET